MSPLKIERGEFVEVLQGQVHIGKELTEFQLLLKEYFFTCLSFGTGFFYGIQVLFILIIKWCFDYKRQQRENGRINYDDDGFNDIDVSENLEFDEMTNNDNNNAINQNDTNDNSVPPNEQGNDDNNTTINQNFYEDYDEYFDGEEGEWEDLPQGTGNNVSSSAGVEPSFSRREGTNNYNETGTPINETNNSHTIPDE
jgi:hypothetical protein